MESETRIVLRSPSIGEGNDRIVNHPSQPEDYTDENGAVWQHANPQANRNVGGSWLRVYDPV